MQKRHPICSQNTTSWKSCDLDTSGDCDIMHPFVDMNCATLPLVQRITPQPMCHENLQDNDPLQLASDGFCSIRNQGVRTGGLKGDTAKSAKTASHLFTKHYQLEILRFGYIRRLRHYAPLCTHELCNIAPSSANHPTTHVS